MRLITLVLLLVTLSLNTSFATDYYAANTGSGSTCSEGIPCSIVTVFATTTSGDTIYLREGTFTITASLETSAANVTLTAYTNETPLVTGSALVALIEVEHTGWTISNISMSASAIPDGGSLIRVSNNADADNITIKNNALTILSSTGASNSAAIILQADRADNALIEDNRIIGQGISDLSYLNHGVLYYGGGNTGTKVLNNEMSGCSRAVYVKHANTDTSIGAAEVAYNYMYDNIHGFYGNPVYINFHDNIYNEINLGNN